jgi:hypothetical protein
MNASDHPEPTNLVQVALGICVIALGVLLLLYKQGLVEIERILDLWPLALVLIGGALVWQARRGSATPSLPIGPLIWIVIMGMLLSHTFDRRSLDAKAGDVNVFAVLGRDRRQADSLPLRGARVTALMGRTDLDLTRASMAPGDSAEIDVFTVMGGSDIRVPGHWQVDMDTVAIMGGARDERPRPADDRTTEASGETTRFPAPRLVVRGTIFLGGLTVRGPRPESP